MEYSCRRTDSLISLCIDYVVKNLSEYVNTKNSLSHFPLHLKTRMLKKFLASSFFWSNVNFNDALSKLVHPSTQRIDLTLVNVNDDLLHILKDCHQLRDVYLTRVKNYDLTSQGLIEFLQPLKNLFMLQLTNCHAVDDEVINTLSKCCPSLAGLDVGGCRQLTNKSLEAMSTMKHLQWLNFSGSQVGNKGVETLVSGPSGTNLKELRLSNCNNITANVLQSVIQFCPNIEVLVFYNMEQKECTNEETSLPLHEGTLKNLKQLTWTVQW